MFELHEADEDVGDLHAQVVDVVLHLDLQPAEAQHARNRVAQCRVPQVTDVRRLVGIDGRVLDDRLFRSDRLRRHLLPHARQEEGVAIEIQIQIAVGRRNNARHPRNLADRLRQFLGDRARRLPQRSRQLKGDRHREIAEGAVGRHFDGKVRNLFQAVLPADRGRDGVVDVSLNGENHRCVESVGLAVSCRYARATITFCDLEAPRGSRTRPACSRWRAADRNCRIGRDRRLSRRGPAGRAAGRAS